MLDAGDYVIRSFIKAKRNIQLNISGSTDILKGDKKEKPIDIDSVILPLDFQDTFNTEFLLISIMEILHQMCITV